MPRIDRPPLGLKDDMGKMDGLNDFALAIGLIMFALFAGAMTLIWYAVH